MFSILTRTHVPGLSGREITDFLSTCTDEAFRGWWPGTHFHLHTVRGTPGSIGSVVFMEEIIGDRSIKVTCELVDLIARQTLVWRLRRPLFRLPVRLVLQLKDYYTGVVIEQSIESGVASRLDPAFRLLFSARFAAAKDEHVRTEFPKLRDFLRNIR